jgi:hypothetical protein
MGSTDIHKMGKPRKRTSNAGNGRGWALKGAEVPRASGEVNALNEGRRCDTCQEDRRFREVDMGKKRGRSQGGREERGWIHHMFPYSRAGHPLITLLLPGWSPSFHALPYHLLFFSGGVGQDGEGGWGESLNVPSNCLGKVLGTLWAACRAVKRLYCFSS